MACAARRRKSGSPSRSLRICPRITRADPQRSSGRQVGQDLLHELVALLAAHGGAAGGGAGRLDAADVAKGEVVAEEAVQAGVDERPGAHVLGLLLQPVDL